jgi:thiol:disulfide interchange protein DsbD
VLKGPHGIVVFDDYEKGLAYAKTVNKPIMLDFTGYACVNCRKMENNVWSDAMILPILNNEVVLISLYVDDKRDLPKNNLFRKQLVLKLKQ